MTPPTVVRVTTRPNPTFPGAALLDFAEDCPYCGKRHTHGSQTGDPGPGRTFGSRVPHCAWHTHETRRDGRRARVTRRNACAVDHPPYVLVPVPPEAPAPPEAPEAPLAADGLLRLAGDLRRLAEAIEAWSRDRDQSGGDQSGGGQPVGGQSRGGR